jgi:hypothetical protein
MPDIGDLLAMLPSGETSVRPNCPAEIVTLPSSCNLRMTLFCRSATNTAVLVQPKVRSRAKLEVQPVREVPWLQQTCARILNWPRSSEFLQYSSDYGSFGLVDFSRHGACIQGSVYFGKGVQLRLWPVVPESTVADTCRARLVESRVFPLVAEVCWGRTIGSSVLQGIRFQGLSGDQIHDLFEFHLFLADPNLTEELSGELKMPAG